jgi:hypothetical protein
VFPEPAARAERGECYKRAQYVNLVFSLHALAAWKMLRQRKIRCCRAAGKPAIRAECSRDQRSNSQTADKPNFEDSVTTVRFRMATNPGFV